MTPHLLLPFVASFGYALASLILKRGLSYGIGPWRTCFIVNLIGGLVFLPIVCLGGIPAGWVKIYQPLLAGLGFFIGQIYIFRAIARGDVSIVTPVLGLKSILIATLLALFFGEEIRTTWWIASALSVVAVLLLADRSPAHARNILATARLAFLGALVYSLTDVLVQRWAHNWGVGYFLPIMFGTVALLSFTLLPKFSHPLRQIPLPGWKWLIGGSFLLGVQSLVMAYAIGQYGHATAMNIVYSSRGIWTIALVWIVGHWFGSDERHLSRGILFRRFLGSTLLVLAIALL